MRLSVLERMLKEVDLSLDALRFLLGCACECEWLDYKSDLKLESDKEIGCFAKDALAMKNVGGGYILVGVEDKTWKPIGIPSPLAYDSKMLRDKIRKASGVDLEINIVHHHLQIGSEYKLLAVIFIRSSRKRGKRRIPTLVREDFHPRESFGLRHGEIYVRRNDSTERLQSDADLEELLDRLEGQSDEDAITASGEASPFAVSNGLYLLLEKGYNTFVARKTLREQIVDAVTRDPRIWIVNVHGPGGVGKSALVTWATYEFYERRAGLFESIIHLSAKETMLTQTGIRPCARTLYSLDDLLDRILTTFEEKPPAELDKKKEAALDILSAWETLLVLDNMETVSDGRIMDFLRALPAVSRSKVLLTSRQRTGGWELAVPVPELDLEETREFLSVKSREMSVDFPVDAETCRMVREISGGLPLAIHWIIGRYKIKPDLDIALEAMQSRDSPVLEFSFRNIWRSLSPDAQAVLAVVSIFDGPPTIQQLAIATEWNPERIERAVMELGDVTLLTRATQQADGRIVHIALPITLRFAQHELANMGEFEARCRRRYQQFTEQMALQESEVHRFVTDFQRYGLETDNEKRAAILCKRGQSEMFGGNADNADMMFRQARELAPQSSYVFAMSASYELARNRVGISLGFADAACKLATKKTGALCYAILARVLWVQGNKRGRVDALQRALEFDPSNVVLKHQYGVALSWAGHTERAVNVFTEIIKEERLRTPPRETLLMALKTRIINLRRLGQYEDARLDLEYAKEILAQNPHLSDEAGHIADLDEEVNKRPPSN